MIEDELNRIKRAKASIKVSIENKGVAVPSNVLLDGYPRYISMIEGSGEGGTITSWLGIAKCYGKEDEALDYVNDHSYLLPLLEAYPSLILSCVDCGLKPSLVPKNNAYIYTNIQSSYQLRVECYQTMIGTADGVMFGGYNSASGWTVGYGLFCNYTQKIPSYWGHYTRNNNNTGSLDMRTNGVIQNFPVTFDKNKLTFSDGSSYTYKESFDTFNTNLSLWCGNYNNGTAFSFSNMGVSYWKVKDYNSGEEIHLVPFCDDGVWCLVDLNTGDLYKTPIGEFKYFIA